MAQFNVGPLNTFMMKECNFSKHTQVFFGIPFLVFRLQQHCCQETVSKNTPDIGDCKCTSIWYELCFHIFYITLHRVSKCMATEYVEDLVIVVTHLASNIKTILVIYCEHCASFEFQLYRFPSVDLTNAWRVSKKLIFIPIYIFDTPLHTLPSVVLLTLVY